MPVPCPPHHGNRMRACVKFAFYRFTKNYAPYLNSIVESIPQPWNAWENCWPERHHVIAQFADVSSKIANAASGGENRPMDILQIYLMGLYKRYFTCSKTWDNGRYEIETHSSGAFNSGTKVSMMRIKAEMFATRFRWVKITPLGLPVVPEV